MESGLNNKSIDKNFPLSDVLHKLLFLIFAICVACAVLYTVTESALLGYGATVLICFTVFFSTDLDAFYLIFGLQFLYAIIPFRLGSSNISFLFFAYLVLIVKNAVNEKFIDVESSLAILLLISDIVISSILGFFKIGDNFLYIGSLIYLVYMIKKESRRDFDIDKLILFFCLAELAICIINILAEYRIFGESLNPEMYGEYNRIIKDRPTFGSSYGAVAGGNSIAIYDVLCIALCVMRLKYVSVIRKIVNLLFVAFFLYTGVFVISRAFYVEIILFIVLYILSQIKSPKAIIVTVILIAAAAAIFYFVAYDYLLSLFQRVLARFARGNQDREDLIGSALELLKSNKLILLFGAGSYYPTIYGFTAHNLYLDTIVSFGIFGGIIYWFILASVFYNGIKSALSYTKIPFEGFIPLIMLFIFKFVSGSTRDISFYYCIAICLIYLIYCTKRKYYEKINSIHTDL